MIFGGSLFNTAHARGGLYTHVAVATLLAVLGLVSWLVTRWCLEDGVLRIETGLIRRSSLRFPLTQVQAIDTVRPGLARIFGLAELRLRTAGNAGGSGRLAYLQLAEADALRTELLALARGGTAAGGPGTPAAPERVLTAVPAARLIASVILSAPALVGLAAVAAVAVTALVSPRIAIAAGGSGGAAGLAVLTMLWRRFNSGFRLTVAEAPDGLRLRSGLIEVSAETIPAGRVQAVRMVEPLLWRPFGWCRLEVDVAGRQRGRGENQAEARQLRAVLPVGSGAEAALLLSRILPDAPTELESAPGRARWKNPLRFHNLAWGRNQACAVTTTGRLARVTSWVPLAKVQSLRLVEGPVQRWLRLATVHLDTAGRSVHAALTDRDRDQARQALEELTLSCRAARARQAAPVAPGARIAERESK